MNRIYLGSTNKAKINAVMKAIPDYEVIGIPVESKVRPQPLDDEETIQGALNRAQQLPKDGLRVGLEAGVNLHNGILFMVNWGVLIDEKGQVYYAGGTRVPLTEEIKHGILVKGEELSTVMGQISTIENIKEKEGAIGYFTCNQVVRSDIFVHIVKLLYGQYLFNKGGK